MNASSHMPRVVVVGGGIFGASAAFHLSRLGADVTLVTEAEPANGASGRSLAWLNSSRRRSRPYHELRMQALGRYRQLARHHPGAAWLRLDGGLTWDADDAANEIAAIHAHEREIGYETRLLSPQEVTASIPGVDARAVTPQGAIFNAGEGWVDLPSLVALLIDGFAANGGRLIGNAGRAAVGVVDGRVTGVATASGRAFGADVVLLAAGAAVPSIVAEAGVCLPETSPISLLVRTKPIDVGLKVVLNTPRVALRPNLGGTIVLDSAWAEREIVVRGDGTYAVDDDTVQRLLAEASRVLEGNPVLELGSYGVGPKPIPQDGEPVLGPLEQIAGYYVAFSHSGATLGLIAGEMLAREIVSGTAEPALATFRPARFRAREWKAPSLPSGQL